MDAALRAQIYAAAEFSGRLPARHCPGHMLTSRSRLQRDTPYCDAGRQRQCHYSTSTAVVHAPSGGHRQANNRRPAALRETAPLANNASGSSAPASPSPSTSALEPPQHVAAAAARASTAVAPAARQADAVGHSGAVAQSSVYSPTSSLEDLGTASSSSDVELDSDEPEMCSLVTDPSGDVQVVCESDPSHPLSLAEAAVFNPPLPSTLLQDIEAKLEADLVTIAVTILFAVGFISLEFGINDLIEHYYGESVFADVVCVSVGLAVVFWVKLSKARLMRFDRWR
ncbi:hypothetical protein PLESTB_000462400 [Pleodorina starrii]|uniref:Uncharacterized protein n=1 Tax=Pleodorina starrii TaxID=330485 RepID=A0A9W6BFZ2_9CHLO|nr:hypothetical protein PLESTM_000796900 [Pleodorina starrii]GLC51068.1 hypothetical protein PLESTB_000462400 [Pleodorina starrii]